jgi:methylenetetrahydrofolate--tRNA-(uracil-5-)-methyltransferase
MKCGRTAVRRRTSPDGLAELVCSNSLRSDDAESNAVGLLMHEEMRRCGSLILAMGRRPSVPAGGALAVDREGFSHAVQAALETEPLVEIRREESKVSPIPGGIP